MAYKVAYHPRFERDMKAFKKNHQIKNQILDLVNQIIVNPQVGESYHGKLMGHHKCKWGDKPEYRLVFRLYECCKIKGEPGGTCPVDSEIDGSDECKGLIAFIHVKTREEFNNHYQRDKEYFDETLVPGMTVKY